MRLRFFLTFVFLAAGAAVAATGEEAEASSAIVGVEDKATAAISVAVAQDTLNESDFVVINHNEAEASPCLFRSTAVHASDESSLKSLERLCEIL